MLLLLLLFKQIDRNTGRDRDTDTGIERDKDTDDNSDREETVAVVLIGSEVQNFNFSHLWNPIMIKLEPKISPV